MKPDALLDLFVLSPVGMVALDEDGWVEVANPAAKRLLHPFSRSGELAPFFDVLSPWVGDLGARARGFDEPRGVVADGVRLLSDGGHALLLSLVKRSPGRFVALVTEAAQLAALDAETRALAARLRAVDRGVRDYALYVVDADGVVRAWSESAERVHQCGAAEIVGQSMATLVPGSSGGEAHVRDLLREAAQHGWSEHEGERVRRDGTPFPASTVVAALDDGGAASHFQVITRDLSERRRLEQLAVGAGGSAVDDLTGVGTRRSFYETAALEISRARRYGQRLSVLLVDLDQFRAVNDTHGTEFGDEALRTIASICREESRNTDVIGRVEGEEFAVLLPSTELSGGLVLAERIRERMQRHVFPGDQRGGRCTVSVGVAELVGDVATVDALLGMAATAVERAKSAGHNLVVGLDDGV
jgi:diguanylate cyclase (GGDEF)-like protein/PAS domain S-box-containing protein